jgi:hypothetical protein
LIEVWRASESEDWNTKKRKITKNTKEATEEGKRPAIRSDNA